MKIEDSCFKLFVFGRLNVLRSENTLCDVSLQIDGQLYPAHKNILAAASPYFFGLFTTDMQEKSSTTIKIEALSSKVVKEVLDYMYTGEIDIQFSNVKEIIQAADYLLIPSLKNSAISFLKENLSTENCVDLRQFGIKFNCPSLQLAADVFIMTNFQAISQTTGFKELDLATVAEWTSKDDITISKEEVVLDSVLGWIKYDQSNRKAYLEELLKNVRMFSMSKFSLQEYFQKEVLIHESLNCTRILMEGLRMHLFPDIMLQSNQRPRQCLENEVKVAIVTGGHSSVGKIQSMLAYALPDGGWFTFDAQMPYARTRHCAAVCGGFLYILGGTPVDNFEKFDHRALAWSCLKQPKAQLIHAAVAVYKEKILVFGGENQLDPSNSTTFLNLVQEYDPKVNEWRVLSPMTCPRAAHCAAVVGNFVYVIGGSCGENKVYTSGERYDPITDEWTPIKDMNQQRRFAASANLKGKVAILGGYDIRWTACTSCELYNPDTDQWEALACMPSPRAACGIVQIQDHVYLFGGESGAGHHLNSVIYYNSKEGSWNSLDTLPSNRVCLQACIINLPRSILRPLM